MVVFNETTVQTIDNQNNNKMKTRTFSIIAFTVFALGIGTAAKAATIVNNKEVSTELTNVSKINKIEIRGNVELFVSDGQSDKVKVYNHYYAQNALVQNSNGVLRISSYNNEKLVVWVTASDLSAISAYDNAEVKSFGKLAEMDLTVDLYNNASAKLDLDSYSTNVNVNDHAHADLAGNVSEFDLKYDRATSINQAGLVAEHSTKMMKADKYAQKDNSQELAGL
jgi:hypothetical protein